MAFTKFATFEQSQVLEVKGSPVQRRTASLDKLSDFEDYRTGDGYMYVRIRAISSRTNKNHDGWPSVELAGSPEILDKHKHSSGFTVEAADGNKEYGFATFMGKPFFVDHNNSDPKRARGVVVDAKLRVLPKEASLDKYYSSGEADPEHLPPTEVELLIECDAKKFPKLAKAIRNGDIDGFSMGCDVEKSKCSHCGHMASNPEEYCSHIVMKGAHHDFKTADGKRISRKSYENCFPAETPVLLGDHRNVPIRDVREGSTVIDHLGEPRKVIGTLSKQIKENILEISRAGQGTNNSLRTTKTHPLLAVQGKKKDLVNGNFLPEFIEAKDLRVGDWVVETSPRHNGLLKTVLTPRISHYLRVDIPESISMDEDFGRWCGWYLAEGSISYNRLASGERSEASVIFSLHKDEQVEKEEILNLGKRLFDLKGVVETRNNGLTISFHNRPLALFMSQLGTSSLTKALPFEWMDAPIQFINGVISAHQKGDGHQDQRDGHRPNEIQHSTSSTVLADQLYNMNIWLGRTPSRRQDLPSKTNKRTVPGNIIVYPELRQRSPRGRIETDQWRLSKITEIAEIEFEGPVYNLEVADTHTYIANGQAVHNCYGIKFFEISAVFDPADETALTREIKAAVQHEADNPLPQSFEPSAPEEVDTLRKQQVCPVCGEDMEGDTCETCGYEAPPEGFNNPDLTKAKEIQQEFKDADAVTVPNEEAGPTESEGPPAPNASPPAISPPGGGTQPGSFMQQHARNSNIAPNVIGDMNWEPKINPHVAGRINQNERPIRSTIKPATNEPTKETVISDQNKAVTSSATPTMLTAQKLIQRAKLNQTGESMSRRTADGATAPDAAADKRTDVEGVGGVLDASNEQASQADSQVDVNGVGGTGVEGVEADSTQSLPTAGENSDDAGFNKDKTTDDSGPTKTYDDSDGSEKAYTDPVTSTPFPSTESRTAGDSEPWPNDEIEGGSANKGTQPVDSVGKAQDRVDVLKSTTTPDNNSGPTKTWTGTDGNGVTKQQDPITHELQENNTNDGWTSHYIAALKVADTEVELGILNPEDKYSRLADLVAQSDEVIATTETTLSNVKTAGMKRLAEARTASVRKLPPAFGKRTAAPGVGHYDPRSGEFANSFQRVATGTEQTEPEVHGEDAMDAGLFM